MARGGAQLLFYGLGHVVCRQAKSVWARVNARIVLALVHRDLAQRPRRRFVLADVRDGVCGQHLFCDGRLPRSANRFRPGQARATINSHHTKTGFIACFAYSNFLFV